MKTILRTAVLCGLIVLVIGCRGAVSGQVTVKWPTAPPLTGTAPTGYWWCVQDNGDWDELRTSNQRRKGPYLAGCRSRWTQNYAIEIKPGGDGNDLAVYVANDGSIPSAAVRLAGSDSVFDRVVEFKWQLNARQIHFQTTENRTLDMEEMSADVLRVKAVGFGHHLMIRIGSGAYQTMMAFRACVASNYNKPLFKVKDCGNPLPIG